MEEVIKEVIKFRDERNWKQFHNAKDLSISLVLEASELLENFQWKESEEALQSNLENIKDELADVLIYALMLSHDLGLDSQELIRRKLKKNVLKYPVHKSYGSNKKYTDF